MAVIEAAVISAQEKRATPLPLSEAEKALWSEAFIRNGTVGAND